MTRLTSRKLLHKNQPTTQCPNSAERLYWTCLAQLEGEQDVRTLAFKDELIAAAYNTNLIKTINSNKIALLYPTNSFALSQICINSLKGSLYRLSNSRSSAINFTARNRRSNLVSNCPRVTLGLNLQKYI
jgi:hypothetical protein